MATHVIAPSLRGGLPHIWNHIQLLLRRLQDDQKRVDIRRRRLLRRHTQP
jgi:hypothetical protein